MDCSVLTNHRGEGSPARRAPLRGERSCRRGAPSEIFHCIHSIHSTYSNTILNPLKEIYFTNEWKLNISMTVCTHGTQFNCQTNSKDSFPGNREWNRLTPRPPYPHYYSQSRNEIWSNWRNVFVLINTPGVNIWLVTSIWPLFFEQNEGRVLTNQFRWNCKPLPTRKTFPNDVFHQSQDKLWICRWTTYHISLFTTSSDQTWTVHV